MENAQKRCYFFEIEELDGRNFGAGPTVSAMLILFQRKKHSSRKKIMEGLKYFADHSMGIFFRGGN
jgi:hypothetical protein